MLWKYLTWTMPRYLKEIVLVPQTSFMSPILTGPNQFGIRNRLLGHLEFQLNVNAHTGSCQSSQDCKMMKLDPVSGRDFRSSIRETTPGGALYPQSSKMSLHQVWLGGAWVWKSFSKWSVTKMCGQISHISRHKSFFEDLWHTQFVPFAHRHLNQTSNHEIGLPTYASSVRLVLHIHKGSDCPSWQLQDISS